jgi:hypothetical protein
LADDDFGIGDGQLGGVDGGGRRGRSHRQTGQGDSGGGRKAHQRLAAASGFQVVLGHAIFLSHDAFG